MKIKNKKGFTLVELIVVVAILALIGVALISIMTPASNVFTKMQKQAQAKMIASEVMQMVEPQVRFGTNLKLVSSIVSGDNNRYLYASTSDYKFYLRDTGDASASDLFGSSFYNGYRIKMTCGSSGNMVTVSITVSLPTDTTVTSTLTTSIQNQNTGSIVDNGDILCYQWLTAPAAT